MEELADIYLGYIYDMELRAKLIADLVSTVFNKHSDGIEEQVSVLDSQIIAEYFSEMGREHGVSPESTFFGRVTLPRVPGADEESKEKTKTSSLSSFVYTGCTVRLLE